MGLNNLVGGRGFTMGKFTSNFNSAASSGNLKKFKDPILKIVRTKATAIQGGRFNSAEALRRLSADEKLGHEAKRDIGRILKRLEAIPTQATPKITRKEIIDRALKTEVNTVKSPAKDRPEKAEIKVRINRANEIENDENIKDSRVAATQARLNASTGVSSPKPTPPPAATPEAAPTSPERINFN